MDQYVWVVPSVLMERDRSPGHSAAFPPYVSMSPPTTSSANAAHTLAPSGDRAGRPRFLDAIDLLRRARLYAADTQRDHWDFAVESAELEKAGLTATDFRWLICKGFVLHGSELNQPESDSRVFRQCNGLTFDVHSCFVLTDKGLEFANSILDPTVSLCDVAEIRNASSAGTVDVATVDHGSLDRQRPRWDCDSRELRYQGRLVKQFKVPSPNQEIVIMSFEEEDWPTCIDDPLPHHGDRDPKQRLHDTIRSLNRNQKNRMLRFKGNGTGQGIIWEPVPQEGSK